MKALFGTLSLLAINISLAQSIAPNCKNPNNKNSEYPTHAVLSIGEAIISLAKVNNSCETDEDCLSVSSSTLCHPIATNTQNPNIRFIQRLLDDQKRIADENCLEIFCTLEAQAPAKCVKKRCQDSLN